MRHGVASRLIALVQSGALFCWQLLELVQKMLPVTQTDWRGFRATYPLGHGFLLWSVEAVMVGAWSAWFFGLAHPDLVARGSHQILASGRHKVDQLQETNSSVSQHSGGDCSSQWHTFYADLEEKRSEASKKWWGSRSAHFLIWSVCTVYVCMCMLFCIPEILGYKASLRSHWE